MRMRRHWGVVIRHLHKTDNSALARAIARLRHNARVAVFYAVLQGCPAVKPHRPETVLRAMEMNFCVLRRITEAEKHLIHDHERFIVMAIHTYGERHWVGRTLMASETYRERYVRWLTDYRQPTLYEFLRHKWIRRLAKRNQRVRKKGWFRRLFLLLLMPFVIVTGALMVSTNARLAPGERASVGELLEDSLKMMFTWFIG